ncbi:MarR family winged helix-turn-helix transcriptional regulator [Roseomonas chloroacetimidivorans]|jgi:DNA-binding MarR family transcriptional regulator|uniref:MarR family winged helix-turn-helix transcriptional regulator n=1 Tax=Roseomonas chloroacetimidivorans TaxID=1766656 RepID=UPI003C742A73
MNAITPPPPRKRAAPKAKASADPAEAVSSPELRQLIERLPLWRRPGYLVRRLHQIHQALFLEECAEFDITPVQYGLLTTLSLRPDADQSSLGAEVGLDRTNVADVLGRLARRGLVSRRRGSRDQRTMVARLTPMGAKLTKEMHAAMSRAQERFLSPLDEGERQHFVETLMRLIDANNHHGRAVLGKTED